MGSSESWDQCSGMGMGSQPPSSLLQLGMGPLEDACRRILGFQASSPWFNPGECLSEALWYFGSRNILTCCLLFALLHRSVRIQANKEKQKRLDYKTNCGSNQAEESFYQVSFNLPHASIYNYYL